MRQKATSGFPLRCHPTASLEQIGVQGHSPGFRGLFWPTWFFKIVFRLNYLPIVKNQVTLHKNVDSFFCQIGRSRHSGPTVHLAPGRMEKRPSCRQGGRLVSSPGLLHTPSVPAWPLPSQTKAAAGKGQKPEWGDPSVPVTRHPCHGHSLVWGLAWFTQPCPRACAQEPPHPEVSAAFLQVA